MEKGQVQVYTGNGKGKTTASMGLALRSTIAGYSVFIGQFMKDIPYNEYQYFSKMPNVDIVLFGTGEGLLKHREPNEKDKKFAQSGYEQILKAATSGQYDVVLADEINVACFFHLLSEEDILTLIEKKSPKTELILTGRYASPKVIEAADLVTEMKEIKHYYKKGLPARNGIEK